MGKATFDDLAGQVCVLTGGAGVIGRTLVQGLAGAGIKTAILDLDGARAAQVAEQTRAASGVETIGVAADVLARGSLTEAHAAIRAQLGPVDLLINAAGGNSPQATTQVEFIRDADKHDLRGTFFGLDIDGCDQVFALNFRGTLLPSMVFATDMLERGRGAILNISSMNSFRPLTKIPAYSAAKASINNFTEWLAVHLAQQNIRVNAVAPGFFLTSQNRFLLIDEQTGALTARGQRIIEGTPMAKFGDPADLVGTVLFLLSDLSAFITGVVIPVDGGFNAYSGV
ncbi:MAG: D-mannonate oxidoreductase [Planctomycetes bacterium RBG_16_64_10]|nr:MAG: D-mannonate oxidoreductase [Planctomycetes bacterium RBG_16_64_10]